MATTRPGGVYQQPDGSLTDAEGNKIDNPKAAEKEAAEARASGAPAGAAETGGSEFDRSVKMYGDLSEKSKDELVEFAAKHPDVKVTREDGRTDLEPTRADYLKAFGQGG